MAIFPNLKHEATVQENDKTRLDATGSFASKDEASISLVEIEPESGSGFVDVTGSDSEAWFLDWEYTTEETKTVSVRVTTDGAPTTKIFTLEVVTSATDKLFSDDTDLLSHEPSIRDLLPNGKNSFKFIHRGAQERILAWLDEQRIWDTDGNRLTKEDITDLDEVKEWSKYETLMMIFEGFSNASDDVFITKSASYSKLRNIARSRAALRLDRDGDGNTDTVPVENYSGSLIRR